MSFEELSAHSGSLINVVVNGTIAVAILDVRSGKAFAVTVVTLGLQKISRVIQQELSEADIASVRFGSERYLDSSVSITVEDAKFTPSAIDAFIINGFRDIR